MALHRASKADDMALHPAGLPAKAHWYRRATYPGARVGEIALIAQSL